MRGLLKMLVTHMDTEFPPLPRYSGSFWSVLPALQYVIHIFRFRSAIA